MIRRVLPAAAAVSVLALAACSSSPGTSSPATSAPAPATASPVAASTATAVNPVTILKATGATVPPGTVTGDHDIEGDRDASGTFPGGEMITVYTCDSQQAFEAAQDRLSPDDDHGEVTIPAKLAVITTTKAGAAIGTASWGGPTPAQIAAKVGGLVQQPQQ